MSKHHHQSREEQINNRIYDAVQFRQKNMPYQKNRSMPTEDITKKADVDDSFINE